MSETYLYNGDAWQSITPPFYYAQVFTPTYDHVLSYIDLEMNWGLVEAYPLIWLHSANPDGTPKDDWLSRSGYFYLPRGKKRGKLRVRTPMQPVLLKTNIPYVMVFSCWVSILETLQWQYDSSENAYYPRGYRLIYRKVTEEWTPYYDQSFLFAEFGNPPLPKPEPPPPIEHFAVPRIEQIHIEGGIRIVISTTVPCKLTLYWSETEPRKHHTSRVVRGVSVPWQTYFCFVAWHTVEQTEEGDTLIHSFDLSPWEPCTIRWFTIKGEVDNIESPSVGPLFKKHYAGPPVTEDFYCRLTDGYLVTVSHIYDYIEAHDTDRANVSDDLERFIVGQSYSAFMYSCDRAGLFFDTSQLGKGASVVSARLNFLVREAYGIPYKIVIVSGDDLSEPLQVHHYHDLLDDTTSLGFCTIDHAWRWYTIRLTQDALDKINKTGITKLALRTDKEIDYIPPTAWETCWIYSAETGAKPYLSITYTKP